jgi:DNA polymerase-1
MRHEAKAINFGILYGQGPHGLAQNAGITYARAQEFIAKYFEAYPGIRKMVDGFIVEAREKGYAITMFGRKRYLPELNSTTVMIRRGAERMAINTPVQGTAADIIKIAMINIAEAIKGKESEIKMLLQIHDELIFEIKEDKVETWLSVVKKLMETAISIKVPIIAESNIGDNWGELK